MKPFLKWVGGKTQLLPELEANLPSEFKTYIEPFIGGGALFFHLLEKYPEKKYIINDINENLINVYKVIRNYPIGLFESISDMENQYNDYETLEEKKQYYLNVREIFNFTELRNMIFKSADFIFLNKTGFNGLYRVNKKGQFNVPFGKHEKINLPKKDLIFNLSELMKNVMILNQDFKTLFDFITPDTFFYLDPPYKPISNTSSFTSYSKEYFNDLEQERLKRFCDLIQIRGGKFMLSNSDHPMIHELYKDYNIQVIEAKRMINSDGTKRGKINELLIKNY